MSKSQIPDGETLQLIVDAYMKGPKYALLKRLHPILNSRYSNKTEAAFTKGFPAWKVLPQYSILRALQHLFRCIKFKVLGYV